MTAVKTDSLFPTPTSVIIIGDSRPLLNWVAYALASLSDPGFHWTDVRLQGEAPTPDDILSRGLIPPNRLSVVSPPELRPDDATANMAVSAVIRDDETPENVRRAVEFLRLPAQTQDVLSRGSLEGPPRVVVLSNGHRLVAIYSDTATVTPTVKAIVGAGAVLIMTFADAAPEGRAAFDVILHLSGNNALAWKHAALRVEKSTSTSAFRAGTEIRLVDFPPVAALLSRNLG